MGTSDPAEIRAWLRLASCCGANPAAARLLLGALGLPQQIFEAGGAQLSRLVGADCARTLLAAPSEALEARIALAVTWVGQPDQHLLALGDAAYPPQLLQIPDPPLILFVRGDPTALGHPLLTILLSQQATAEAVRTTADFAHALQRRQIPLLWDATQICGIPGLQGLLATGVGTQRASLANPSNANRAYSIPKVAVSERLPGETSHSPPRSRGPDRLLAGLCRAVLLVQAARGSEELMTAQLAAELGRDVFAIPGSIHSPLSKASHRLIKDGAKLVESSDDILGELSGFSPQQEMAK